MVTLDTDLFVVTGLVVALMAVPSSIGALADDRFPYIAVFVLVAGLGAATLGISFSPDGYSLARLPHSFVEILARIFN